MARILLGWELGSGLGHVATLLPVAKALAQHGHEPVFVIRNLVETWPLLGNSGFTVLQAPLFFAHGGESFTQRTRSYADILAACGYNDMETLEPLVRAWRNLIDQVNPDLVIAEHAPTLSLASYGRVAVVNLGTGFSVPAFDDDRFPVLNESVPEHISLTDINRHIEIVLQRLGQMAPKLAIRALQGEKIFPAVFAEIDPYRETREPPACGPLWPLPAVVPSLPESPMCLVYLPADHPDLEKLIKGLEGLSMSGMVYVRNASAHVLDQLRNTSLQVSTTPVELDAVLPCVSVVLHHGGAGMTQRCLAYGRPQVIAPIHLEQVLTCTALQEMGVAIKLGGIFSAEQSGAALEQAVNVLRLAQLAQHHAHLLQQRYPRGSLDLVVKACLDKLPKATETRPVSIAFVTTCKGRLHHLQESLPLMIAEQPDEIIVVDYGCPQKAGDWVETAFPAKQFPNIKVVRVTDDSGFSASRAHNVGAKAATTNWICFIDADICVQPGWMKWMRAELHDEKIFYRASMIRKGWKPEVRGTYGTVIVSRTAFQHVDGYDEVFRSWGGEDTDFYNRLCATGIREADYPQAFIKCIPNTDAERTAFYEEKNINTSLLVARHYMAAKNSFNRLDGQGLDLAAREALMRAAQQQIYQPKKFCVMTVGRSGSTSLMTCLEQYDDIAVPNKNIHCVNNELLHEKRVDGYRKEYETLTGAAVETAQQLIERFYQFNSGCGYAGFKTMPNRHPDFEAFVCRNDIQFITLIREDVASTVASFMLAMETMVWQRQGERQAAVWHFDVAQHAEAVLSNLTYVLKSHAAIRSIPNAIALTYEALCSPQFENKNLDVFFNRPIQLGNPKPPTSGRSYVDNWEAFEQFIAQARQRIG